MVVARPLGIAEHRIAYRQIIKPPMITKPTTTQLAGPFSLEQGGIGGCMILGDGSKAVWGYGEDVARKVARLMNVAHKHGYFD